MRRFDYDSFYEPDISEEIWPTDESQEDAQRDITELYDREKSGVYFTKQLWVKFEEKYYHWITDRAIKYLRDIGELRLKIEEPINVSVQWSLQFHLGGEPS
jgi:hypothetical protein